MAPLPARQLLVYGVIGGAIIMIVAITALVLSSTSMQHKESSQLSTELVKENSTLVTNNAPNTETNSATPTKGERYWLAVTRVFEPSITQLDNNGQPDKRSFVVYNSEAPRINITSEMLVSIPSLKNAFDGADGCHSGTEVCEVSHGFSEGGDKDNYELSLSQEEAKTIREQIPLSSKTNDALLEFGDKLYWLVLYTTTDFRTPQMVTTFLEKVPNEPTPLRIGETLQYTMLVKTWSTYGGPVEMKLYSAPSSPDSGVSVRAEPNSVVLNERSEQKVKLIVTPTEKAKEGIYGIRIWGKFYNDQFFWPDNPCQHSACPSVKIGSSSSSASSWDIRSTGGYGGLGGKDPPKWLNLRLMTDKEQYRLGEPIKFTAYLDNNSTDSSIILKDAMMIIKIYPSNSNPSQNVYNIEATRSEANNNTGESLQPGSSIVLAHPFEWDQKQMKDGVLTNNYVNAGRYTIDASLLLVSDGIVFYADKDIVIS